MDGPAVSVIVVSRDRPDALARCLTGLAQQIGVRFEVIVVADDAGCAAVARHVLAAFVRVVRFDRPNISAARNAGMAAAGGEILAFIDDDSVPEPTWLARLTEPFGDPSVAAAGGFVIGRNGISFQWRARTVDATGMARALSLSGDAPVVRPPPPGGAIKTEGTNMALRAQVARDLGGFDEAFEFYLDETDLNLRLARAGLNTAIVPLARVHHGFAASPRRRRDRVPTTLFDVGASSAVFWAKHLPAARHAPARTALLAEQRRRLLRHMVRGTAEPRDIPRLLATLAQGLDAGAQRAVGQLRSFTGAADFRPLPVQLAPTGSRVLSGGWRDRAALLDRAAVLRAEGLIVTALILSPSALYHQVRFIEPGIWLQTGGTFGRSDRRQPLFQRTTRASRITAEIARSATSRGVVDTEQQS